MKLITHLVAFILGFAICFAIIWYSSLHGRHQVTETIAFNVISMSNLQDTYITGKSDQFEKEIICNIIYSNAEVAARADKINLTLERNSGTKQLVEASARAAERVSNNYPKIVSECGS